ncbi:MAG: hypothetical protein ABEK12_01335 [Candidatus Nanohaloarchaea archaeon]
MDEDRMRRIEQRLDDIDRRLQQVEARQADSGGRDPDLSRSLNGLRRQHRDLRETVEEDILDYLEDERSVLQTLQRRVQEYGELMREIKQNRDRLDSLADRLDTVETEMVDTGTFAEAVADLEDMHRELAERVRQHEARIDFLTAD